MGQILTRCVLLNKRLFKKYSFLVILALVPLLVGGMRLAAGEESGVFKIALYMENPQDELSAHIVQGFLEKDSVIQYVLCETEEEARELVKAFEVDEAWIFPENLKENLQRAAADKRTEPVITIVEREETVTLIFTREILCNAMYPFFSYAVYEDFIRDDMGLDKVSDEELKEAYELVEENLFQMEYPDGQQTENISYLLTPIRGILAIWLMLCGFAASMYFMQDEQRGTFSGMPVKHRLWMAFEAHAVLLFDAVVILLAACRLAGVFTVWYREILSAVLFACCTIVFCNLLRLLCRTPEILGSLIPLLLLGMMILCPVFIKVRGWKAVQYLLPPYYYLNSVHSTYYLYGMVVYILILAVLCALVFQWKNKKYN